VDQHGNLIDRHNLWEMVGVRYRRSLFPGFSDTAEYSFRCPGGQGSATPPGSLDKTFRFGIPKAGDVVHVTARLLYRKADQYLLNFMFGAERGLTMPVTELARAETRIQLQAAPRKRATRATASMRQAAVLR